MKLKPLLYSFFVFYLIALPVISQNDENHSLKVTIPKVALISVQSNNATISLQGTNVVTAGKKLQFNSTDNSTWINYSSIIGSNVESSRYVAVEISEGTIPTGLDLVVKASDDTGNGEGDVGKPIETYQVLNEAPVKLIENIGSCYTGVGINKGHNISYKLKENSNSSYGDFNYEDTQIVAVTYTLSDY